MSGNRPRTSLYDRESSSVLLTYRTSQFFGSSASHLMPQLLSAEHELEGVWKQLVIFSSSIITVLTVGRDSKGVIQMSGETLSYTTATYL